MQALNKTIFGIIAVSLDVGVVSVSVFHAMQDSHILRSVARGVLGCP